MICSATKIIIKKFYQVTELRLNRWYIIFYHFWFWILVTGIIPFIIMTVINVKIHFAMRDLKNRLQNNKTRTIESGIGLLVGRSSQEQDRKMNAAEKRQAFKRKRTRTNSTTMAAKECNLAIILICTAVTFFFLHLPRVLTSLYEALTIHKQLHCSAQQKDFLPLWFLYCIAGMNALLVLNASSNILIYLFAGLSFRAKFQEIFGLQGLKTRSQDFSIDTGMRKFLPFCFSSENKSEVPEASLNNPNCVTELHELS